MRIGVVGSRNFNNYELFCKKLDEFCKNKQVDLIVSGGCYKGADKLAEKYAEAKGIKTVIHYPKGWSKGNTKKTVKASDFAARNRLIVRDSDILIAFHDGKSPGTSMTIQFAEQAKKPVLKLLVQPTQNKN